MIDVDDREFDGRVAALLPSMRARARQLCRRGLDADDLVQDAVVRALRCRAQLRDRECLRPWLLSIVTTTFIDAVRRQRVRPQQVPLEWAPAAECDDAATGPAPWHHISPEALRAAVDQLSDDVRHTYRMFALEGRDYIAIAAAQGISKATVGTRLLRARGKLRALLTPAPGDAAWSAAA